MSFLRLNELQVRIEIGTAQCVRVTSGGEDDRWNNRRSVERTRTLRMWTMTTDYLTAEIADTVECIIEGGGSYWSFDSDMWSSDGVRPVPSTVATLSAGALAVTSAAWDVGARTDRFTLLLTRAGVHYAIRSDGAKWVDGVRNDAAVTTWASVTSAGLLSLTGAGDLFDDILLLPCAVAEDYVLTHFLNGITTPPPRLSLDGWVTKDIAVAVDGEVNSVRYRQAFKNGAHRNNARKISFSLYEVG